MTDATRLLNALNGGDARASAELLPLVYEELRRLARGQMAQERGEHTLQATALVHEAYLRLIDDAQAQWGSRRHFFSAAAEAMRRILIDHARRKNAVKHGGEHRRVELHDDLPAISSPCDEVTDLLALSDALDQLAVKDSELAELVKLVFFVGLSLDETADALGMSRATAYRRWAFARAWLHDAITGSAAQAGAVDSAAKPNLP